MQTEIERMTIICDTCGEIVASVCGDTPDHRRAVEIAVEAHKRKKPKKAHQLRGKIEAALV